MIKIYIIFFKNNFIIVTKIFSIESVKSSRIKFPIVANVGAFISSNIHIYLISVLHDFSIPLSDKYPFSINENNITLSKFVRLYLGRPVFLQRKMSEKIVLNPKNWTFFD